MNIHLISPFDKIAKVVLNESILSRAEKKNIVRYNFYNLFEYADPPQRKIDDAPYGGGYGMILKPEPVFRVVDTVKKNNLKNSSFRIIFPTPDGVKLNQKISEELSTESNLIFISGHYKGIDQRIRDEIVTDEISIGDYVLTGGDLPSLVIIDSIVRLIPGVLGSIESAKTDSFSHPLLDYPHYTRPELYRGLKVPEILISGDHANIDKWRQNKRYEKTRNRRPDLMKEDKNYYNGGNNG